MTVDFDRVLREVQHTYNNNRAQAKVLTFGRAAHNPRRRQAPLHDSYDAFTNWLTVVFLLVCSGFAGVGFAKTVMLIARWVR